MDKQLLYKDLLQTPAPHSYLHLGGRLANDTGYFNIYAPHAKQVFLTGDFNGWKADTMPLKKMTLGFWEKQLPDLHEGDKYQFLIETTDGSLIQKADPYAYFSAVRPDRHSILFDVDKYIWSDHAWLKKRKLNNHFSQPMNVYEVHLGSWRKKKGQFKTYQELAYELVEYLKEMHFTHVELLPLAGHPLDESWGYQVSAYFSITSRFGTPRDFQEFVDIMHQNEIGVIIDWVGGHFPTDVYALAQFDGSYLYEHEDPALGFQPKWNTLVFDYSKRFVKNFLLSNLFFWIEKMHIDGIRFDTVTSMIYRDFERENWKPNHLGGKEYFEAIDFLREANDLIHLYYPDVYTIAEEATAFPKVTHPTKENGIGFDYKWGLGWSFDTLKFFKTDYAYRSQVFDKLFFYLQYCKDEKFQLVLSHDDVSHGRNSLFSRMPGSDEEKSYNLLLLYLLMIGFPGKKLLFMGGEFGQSVEWDCLSELQWDELNHPIHQMIQNKTKQLFALYAKESALWEGDFSNGFEWVLVDVFHPFLAFIRKTKKRKLLFVLNLLNKSYLFKNDAFCLHRCLYSVYPQEISFPIKPDPYFAIEIAPLNGMVIEIDYKRLESSERA